MWVAQAERSLNTARLALPTDPNAACSRAYYAMFYAARAALLTAGHTEKAMGKTHAGLISAFGEIIVKPGHLDPGLGRALSRASRDRLIADYVGDLVENDVAERTIEAAAGFLIAVKEWVEAKS